MAEALTLDQQKALAMAAARLRLKQKGGWSPNAEADKIEAASQPGSFSDASASVVMKGIPFADEIVGGMQAPVRAAVDWYNGDGFDLSRSYDRSVAVERELQARRDARSPVASAVGSIAGGTALGGVAAKGGLSLLQGAKPTIASLVGRGAGEGAAYGALYGAGEGEGLDERARNAAFGAGVGGVTGGALGALGRIGATKIDQALPTASDLNAAAQQAYQRAENAGVVYTPQATTRLANDLQQQFANHAFLPGNEPRAANVLNEINRVSGQNTTLKGLDAVRKMAGNAYDPMNRSSNALTAKVAQAIDDLVANPQAGDVLTGNAADAASAITEARSLYSQSRKLELVQELLNRGKLNAASSGSGGNVENASRQQLKRILLDAKKSRGFNSTELKAINDAVMGSTGGNILRLAGKLSPEGNGLMAMLHLLGGSATAGATLPFAAAGIAAKRGSEAMARNAQVIAEAIIANGGKMPATSVSGARRAIIDALTREGARRLPAYKDR